MKKLLATTVLALTAMNASAHSMTPGFEVVKAPFNTTTVKYTIGNHFDRAATFKMIVLDKDRQPVNGWRTTHPEVRIGSDASKEVAVQFKTPTSRKVIVCSFMTKLGSNDKLSQSTQVCSRLILKK